MRKVEEYLQHAAECRAMARTASPAHRQQLEQMAETWEQLAKARRQQLQKSNDNALTIEFETPPTDPSKRNGH